MKLKQIEVLALRTSGVILLFFIVLLLSYFYFYGVVFDFGGLALFIIILHLFIFFIIKRNVTVFSGKKIQKIYNQSSLFKNVNFDNKNVTDDYDSFFNTVSDIIDKKHEEIKELLTRDDFRRDFLGNVSHELKTPLFTAQGYILTLMEGSIDEKELQKKYLDRAHRSIERLEFIVRDLDLISKLETGMKLNYTTFNIIKIISDVFDILEIKAGKKNISLTFDKNYEFPILVNADVKRIEQVLINLVANSINYGKENGITTVSVQLHDKNRLRIDVSDDGIGIKEKNMTRLFQRFYRVDTSRSREHGGSGLGLSIVKHIVEAHDQEVLVESKLGKGSVFSFTLNSVN